MERIKLLKRRVLTESPNLCVRMRVVRIKLYVGVSMCSCGVRIRMCVGDCSNAAYKKKINSTKNPKKTKMGKNISIEL